MGKMTMTTKKKYSSPLPLSLLIIIMCCCCCCCLLGVDGYKNYTVGDSLGWYDSGVKPGVDYQKWASGKTFSLGDFLIFNTDNNRSVTQTYDLATYKTCDNAGDDVTVWSKSAPSSTAVYPVTVPVPLLKEGPTYFFSGDYDGDECKAGQRFQITVARGKGLPPTLQEEFNVPASSSSSSAAADAPGPAADPDSGDDDGDDSADNGSRGTPISADFNHPKNVTTGKGNESEDGQGGDDDDDGNGKTKSSSAPAPASGSLMGFLVRLLIVGFIGVSSYLA